MARGHIDIPKNTPATILSKRDIFSALIDIDNDAQARARILSMESAFRHRINNHIASLPAESAKFQKFNTSPFVIMFYSKQKGYNHVCQIEKDIVPAKVFSSMETSAGRMVETVVLPVYGWETVPSTMHSTESVLDGRKTTTNRTFMAATLKSGPRCLNDEMAKDIGVDVAKHSSSWALSHNATTVDFTYGVLYGTKKQSNKKDWHILRNIQEKLPSDGELLSSCRQEWGVSYKYSGITVNASVRVGIDWWDYLGGQNTWLELCASLIRACITPTIVQQTAPQYIISDLGEIVDISSISSDYNIALLQRSQLEWLLFLARHFCDEIRP